MTNSNNKQEVKAELKLCPFCEGEPRYIHLGEGEDFECFIECQECELSTRVFGGFEEAAFYWNKPVSSTADASEGEKEFDKYSLPWPKHHFCEYHLEDESWTQYGCPVCEAGKENRKYVEAINKVRPLEAEVEKLRKENEELQAMNEFKSLELGKMLMLPHPKDLMDKIASLESTIAKMRKALDDLYNYNKAVRMAVIQVYGVLHDQEAIEPSPVKQEVASAEECLEWVFHNDHLALGFSVINFYSVQDVDGEEVRFLGNGNTPLEAIRSAMAKENPPKDVGGNNCK